MARFFLHEHIFLITVIVSSFSFRQNTSFCIVIDTPHYKAFKQDIETYRLELVKDSLNTFIVSKNWETPNEIRNTLQLKCI